MAVPADLKYSKTHEWVRVDGEIATVGISDHAQDELGTIVYLNLTEVGRILKVEEKLGEIESNKAFSEIFSPVPGEVVETNTAIIDTPDVINSDPYQQGWLIKVRLSDHAPLGDLLDAADYEKHLASGVH